jgi:two-component system nitrogen regulation response regulator GlnG
LQSYDWPGNVRELQSAIKHAFVQATGEVLAPHCLPDSILCRSPTTSAVPSESNPDALDIAPLVYGLINSGQKDVYRQVHLAVDRVLFPEVLHHVGGSQVSASQLLGISRTTLRAKLSSLQRVGNDTHFQMEQASARQSCTEFRKPPKHKEQLPSKRK